MTREVEYNNYHSTSNNWNKFFSTLTGLSVYTIRYDNIDYYRWIRVDLLWLEKF